MAELIQRTDGGGKRVQLVEAQVERVEILQQAELVGERHQTVVAQVQNLQVLELADAGRELLQLQQKKKTKQNTQLWTQSHRENTTCCPQVTRPFGCLRDKFKGFNMENEQNTDM